MITASLAFATPPASEEVTHPQAETLVQQKLVKPLAAKEAKRARFSRVRLPAQEHRVRVLDPHPVKDSEGGSFVAFAVDGRYGIEAFEGKAAGWRENEIVGCVYPERGEVFVRMGDEFRAATVLLGKKEKPAAAHTCQAATTQLASAK